MREMSNRWWPGALVSVVGVSLLLCGFGVLVIVLVQVGTEYANQVSSILGAMLALSGAILTLSARSLARRRTTRLAPTADQIDLAVVTLAYAVRQQRLTESISRQLGNPEPIPIQWKLASANLMDHPDSINPAGRSFFEGRSNQIDTIAEAFCNLPRRRLVIVGGPGTGKTTLAVQLLLKLIPENGSVGPVPIMTSFGSWEPTNQTIQQFLVSQIEIDYAGLRSIHPDVVRALVAQDRILPILDGLDEVPRERRGLILKALNSGLHSDGGVIITSRRLEYRRATTAAAIRLTGSAVIAPQAIRPRDAAEYLGKCTSGSRDDWPEVLHRLATGAAPTLGIVTSSALGLWLVRRAYADTSLSPAALVGAEFDSPSELQTHLLEQIIAVSVQRRPSTQRRARGEAESPFQPSRQHRPEQVREWLTAIAEQMRDTGTRDWAWWLLPLYTFPAAAIAGPQFARVRLRGLTIISLIMIGWFTGELGTIEAIAFVSAISALAGYTGAFTVRGPRHIDIRVAGRVEELARTTLQALAIGALFGVPCAFVLLRGAASANQGMTSAQLVLVATLNGLVSAVVFAIPIALSNFLGSTQLIVHVEKPYESYRAERILAGLVLIASAVAGTLGGLGVALTWQMLGVTAMQDAAFLASMALGGLWITSMTVFIMLIAPSPWYAFQMAGIRYAIVSRRRLPMPMQIMSVLDDCYRLGLLRRIGPIYQFRHAELQDHLAPGRSTQIDCDRPRCAATRSKLS